MFKGNLKPVINGPVLVFRLPVLHRALFFLISALLAVGIIYSPRDSSRLWIPAVFAVISFAGGMYSEKWIFNRKKSEAVYFIGIPFVPFLHKKTEFGFNEIQKFVIEASAQYRRRKETSLTAVLKSGERYEIDSMPGTAGEKIIAEHAAIAAEFCRKPLTRQNMQKAVF